MPLVRRNGFQGPHTLRGREHWARCFDSVLQQRQMSDPVCVANAAVGEDMMFRRVRAFVLPHV